LYWLLISVIYRTHKHRSIENSQWYKNVYYYPWNHFSLKVGVPDEIFDFKAEGIFYYIIIMAHIAVMESRGVDLRFEPNSILYIIYIIVYLTRVTNEFVWISNLTCTCPYIFWTFVWKAINKNVGNLYIDIILLYRGEIDFNCKFIIQLTMTYGFKELYKIINKNKYCCNALLKEKKIRQHIRFCVGQYFRERY